MRINRTVGLLVATGGLVGALATAAGSTSPEFKVPAVVPDGRSVMADIRAGRAPGREVARTVEYMGVWRNCRWEIVSFDVTHYSAGGGAVSVTGSQPREEVAPADPACADVRPKASQVAAMQAQVDTLNARNRPPGVPPPPPMPIPGPEAGVDPD